MKKQLLQLCYEIEKLPASEQQTKVSLMASNLVQMYQSPEKYGSSGEYLQDTPPLMFIEDLHDIMFDGDGLTPDKLVADVVKLIKDYLAAQHGVESDEKPRSAQEELDALSEQLAANHAKLQRAFRRSR